MPEIEIYFMYNLTQDKHPPIWFVKPQNRFSTFIVTYFKKKIFFFYSYRRALQLIILLLGRWFRTKRVVTICRFGTPEVNPLLFFDDKKARYRLPTVDCILATWRVNLVRVVYFIERVLAAASLLIL